jgi:hypothetical protein
VDALRRDYVSQVYVVSVKKTLISLVLASNYIFSTDHEISHFWENPSTLNRFHLPGSARWGLLAPHNAAGPWGAIPRGIVPPRALQSIVISRMRDLI